MMSRTGIKQRIAFSVQCTAKEKKLSAIRYPLSAKNGFTLVEVMVATVVLALGTVFISESLFISLDAYNYYARYLSILAWADEKVWEAQDNLARFGSAAAIPASGNFSEKNKNFSWYLAYTPLEADGSLYRADFELSWQEGSRKARLQRSAYAIHHEPE